MSSVISIENVSKSYRLGLIGRGTLREDLQSWWCRVRGRPDPNTPIGRESIAADGHTLWALRDVSMEVQQGEVLGIIGRNGAGKSTLLKILSRVTAPTSGRIRVKGRVASLLEVGTGFHPELTGRENIFLNGAILGMTKAEVRRKFDEIVAFSEIEQFIDTPVKRYSSGMYVRLAFAVAAHLDPEILVVDEVLAVGDAAFQKKCLGKMGDVAGEGRTVLFVSHNMGAVRQLCGRSVLLSKGTVIRQGNTPELISYYTFENESSVEASSKYIRRVVFCNAHNAEVRSILAGDGGTFRIHYDTGNDTITNVVVTIAINDHNGIRVATLSNYHAATDESFRMLSGAGFVSCIAKELPLTPNQYVVNVALDGLLRGRSFNDRITNVCQLHVMPSNFHGVSRMSEKYNGYILVRQHWECP